MWSCIFKDVLVGKIYLKYFHLLPRIHDLLACECRVQLLELGVPSSRREIELYLQLRLICLAGDVSVHGSAF